MKKLTKAKWEKPEISKLSVKNLTLSGATVSTEENNKSATTKRPS